MIISILDKYPVISFVLITYLFSWILWMPLVLLGENLSINPTFLIILGGFGPFISAIFLTRLTKAKGSVISWLKHIFSVRLNYKWYLFSFTLPLLAGVLTVLFYGLLNQQAVDTSLMSPFSVYPILLAFIFLLGGGQEEPGWRGYALPQLLKKYSPFIASIFIGIMWTFWHTPLFFVEGSAQHNISFFWYLVNTIAISIIVTVLYLKVQNVIPAMILHAGLNALGNYIPFQGGTEMVYPYLTIVNCFLALVLVALLIGTNRFLQKNDNILAPGD